MPFIKGQSGNPNGKEPGTLNKSTAFTKQMITDLLADSYEDVKKEYKSLTGKDKINAFIALMPYVVPRLSSTSLDLDIMKTVERLPEDQIDDIISKIVNAGR